MALCHPYSNWRSLNEASTPSCPCAAQAVAARRHAPRGHRDQRCRAARPTRTRDRDKPRRARCRQADWRLRQRDDRAVLRIPRCGHGGRCRQPEGWHHPGRAAVAQTGLAHRGVRPVPGRRRVQGQGERIAGGRRTRHGRLRHRFAHLAPFWPVAGVQRSTWAFRRIWADRSPSPTDTIG